MDAVDRTLQEWRRTSFAWGERDCLLSIAGYFAMIGLPDVRPKYSRTYSNAEDAARLLMSHGGIDCAMRTMGAVPVNDGPKRGDAVGICYGDTDLIVGLCTGDSVAARLERGVIEAPLRLIRWKGIWRGHR